LPDHSVLVDWHSCLLLACPHFSAALMAKRKTETIEDCIVVT